MKVLVRVQSPRTCLRHCQKQPVEQQQNMNNKTSAFLMKVVCEFTSEFVRDWSLAQILLKISLGCSNSSRPKVSLRKS